MRWGLLGGADGDWVDAGSMHLSTDDTSAIGHELRLQVTHLLLAFTACWLHVLYNYRLGWTQHLLDSLIPWILGFGMCPQQSRVTVDVTVDTVELLSILSITV